MASEGGVQVVRSEISVVRDLVMGLNGTHDDLDRLTWQIGLPIPARDAGAGRGDDGGLSKSQRLQAAADAIDPGECRRLLKVFEADRHLRAGADLIKLQEALWSFEVVPEMNQRVRRELARAIPQHLDRSSLQQRLSGLLEEHIYGEVDANLEWDWNQENPLQSMQRHFLQDGDWSLERVFDHVGALVWPSTRFVRFFQQLISSRIAPDEDRLRRLEQASRTVLERHGLTLVDHDDGSGFPSFEIVSSDGWRLPPQLILFASRNAKPDLRLEDALEKRIEVLSGVSDILAYTETIGPQGLTWSQLQQWWAIQSPVTVDPKRELYQRLQAAVPVTSPQAMRLFKQYHEAVKGRDDFPALLPEVWVHWDPRSKSQRRVGDAAPTHRIDYLILHRRRRIILEVDGQQHYADGNGKANADRYAATMRADRELRLAGYEVYRFGTAELDSDGRAAQVVQPFIERLLWGRS